MTVQEAKEPLKPPLMKSGTTVQLLAEAVGLAAVELMGMFAQGKETYERLWW